LEIRFLVEIFLREPHFEKLVPGETRGTIFFEKLVARKKGLPVKIRAIK
jgi:hypothetical protein